jgi:ubiquitin-conjugating enzyme E2 Z
MSLVSRTPDPQVTKRTSVLIGRRFAPANLPFAQSLSYSFQIRHETLRIAVIQKLEEALGIQPDGTIEPPTPAWDPEADAEVEEELAQMADAEKPRFEPFKDLYKRRLLWYYDTYLQTIETYAQKNKDGERFEKMPFEGGSNSMDGMFQYTDLRRRLSFIKDVIYAETNKWAEEGMIAKQRELSVAANLQRQFEQLVEHHKITNMVTLNVELVNGNPFVWQITYFGRPMTHLDGGVFRIRVCLSPRFPDEQPRVRIETPIYHHRVSKDGIVCYFPKKLDEGSMKGHVEAIIEALEDESPPFDPRTIVHPEATKLFWGSAEDKKKYNRMLRVSVQKTDDPSGVGRAPD